MQHWTDWGPLITLGQGQPGWEWAKGRLTAGTVLDLRRVRGHPALPAVFPRLRAPHRGAGRLRQKRLYWPSLEHRPAHLAME
ncbi:MAG: hypothetical protein WKG07_35295 [Hymenobacter sp.]